MNKEKLRLDLSSKDWIRCQSKSHTGRFYMFNKATGETKWCSLDADAVAGRSDGSISKRSGKKESPPKVINKFVKTPAQDRLKRLQSNLFKDIKQLKEKSPKKERTKNSTRNINSPTRRDGSNKIKQALSTEKMLVPAKATATATHNKPVATTSKAVATTSKAMVTPSKAVLTPSKAIVTPSKAVLTPSKAIVTPSKTTAVATPSTTIEIATTSQSIATSNTIGTAENDSDIVETKSLREETPRLSYYGRRLRQCSDTLSPYKSSDVKQSTDQLGANKTTSSDKPIAEKPSDNDIVEIQTTSKSSEYVEDKRSTHLKRRSIQRSPKRSTKKCRLLTHKSVRFNPAKGANISIGNKTNDDDSSADAGNTSDNSKNSTLRVGIIDKIKAICKSTFRMSSIPNTITKSTIKVTKTPGNLGITTSLASLQTAYKVFRDCSERERNVSEHAAETTPTSAVGDKIVLLPAVRSTNTSLPPTTAECNTPISQAAPAYPRGSANTRLERLRQSLFLQPSSSAKNRITDPTPSSANTIDLSEKHNNSCYNSNNNGASSEASEPMDWQSIEDYPGSNSVEFISIDTSNTPEVGTNPSPSIKTDTAGTVSEYYDSVNANLLRFSAEQQDRIKWSAQKWLTDHYYFVIDTNVLLQNITFIDDLIEMKLCDTNGTIIYIPYCVLQELDKLKMRSSSESAKTLTVRAIKYLNKKFEERNKHIHAQSAIDERDHLIDVTSADDSILNCCLHVKRHVENVVLLTEDVNLRNKAICNNLLVSTKSDLISKHAEPSTSTSTIIWQDDARK